MEPLNLTSSSAGLIPVEGPMVQYESELERQCMEDYVPSNRSAGKVNRIYMLPTTPVFVSWQFFFVHPASYNLFYGEISRRSSPFIPGNFLCFFVPMNASWLPSHKVHCSRTWIEFITKTASYGRDSVVCVLFKRAADTDCGFLWSCNAAAVVSSLSISKVVCSKGFKVLHMR